MSPDSTRQDAPRRFRAPAPDAGQDGAPENFLLAVGARLRTLRARRLNWIAIPVLTAPMRVRIKIRHRHEPAWATLEPAGEDEVVATFDEPQRAVTPGQSAVFYDGDEVVGGGWIV